MSELVYDVQNKTHLTGRSRDTGNNPEQVAHMQANDDEENADQVMRSIGNAYSNLVNELSEFIENDGNTGHNTLIGDEDLSVTLSMPSNFNSATNGTLASAMHQYIVNLAISDWFTITNKADAADYAALAAANIAQIRSAANKRTRPVRKTVELPESPGDGRNTTD